MEISLNSTVSKFNNPCKGNFENTSFFYNENDKLTMEPQKKSISIFPIQNRALSHFENIGLLFLAKLWLVKVH